MRSVGAVLSDLIQTEMSDEQRRLVLELAALATAPPPDKSARSAANARYYQKRKTMPKTELRPETPTEIELKNTEKVLIQSGSRIRDNLLSTEISGKKENKNLVDFGFEQFWKVCPRKAGKGAARTAWVRACRKADPPTILAGLERAKLGWRDVEPQFIPHPATWLNQERWLDEPPGNGPPGVRLVQDEDFTRRGLERLRQTGLIADG